MRLQKVFAGSGAMFAAIALSASLVALLPAQVSHCTICGAREITQPVGLRFGGHTLFRFREVSATEFSALLAKKNLVEPHAHVWHRAQFVADPLDESGPPVFESLEALNAPRVIEFTRSLAEYADPATMARWRELILQPQHARVLEATLHFLQPPASGLTDRGAFLAWWGRNSLPVYNRVRELTEPD